MPSPIRALFYPGSKTVASSGTPEPISSVPFAVESVRIIALSDNSEEPVVLGFKNALTGDIVYGIDLPFAITATPGRSIDLSHIYVQVGTNGDGVSYLGLN